MPFLPSASACPNSENKTHFTVKKERPVADFACQFENLYGPAFFEDLKPPPSRNRGSAPVVASIFPIGECRVRCMCVWSVQVCVCVCVGLSVSVCVCVWGGRRWIINSSEHTHTYQPNPNFSVLDCLSPLVVGGYNSALSDKSVDYRADWQDLRSPPVEEGRRSIRHRRLSICYHVTTL